MHYRYKGPVILIPWIESWDFKGPKVQRSKGPKVLPEHATLPIPDNVIYFDAIRKLGSG